MKTFEEVKIPPAGQDSLAETMRTILSEIGEDPLREGLLKTPVRAAKAMREMTRGYSQDPDSVFNGAFFKTTSRGMVTVTGINFYSLCEHHLVPFFGKAHVAYVPDGRIVGLSKITRLVRLYSARLQVQERLTRQIAETLFEKLRPAGAMVVLEARHLCMEMRGAKTQETSAVTTETLGIFGDDSGLRREFLGLIKRGL